MISLIPKCQEVEGVHVRGADDEEIDLMIQEEVVERRGDAVEGLPEDMSSSCYKEERIVIRTDQLVLPPERKRDVD